MSASQLATMCNFAVARVVLLEKGQVKVQMVTSHHIEIVLMYSVMRIN